MGFHVRIEAFHVLNLNRDWSACMVADLPATFSLLLPRMRVDEAARLHLGEPGDVIYGPDDQHLLAGDEIAILPAEWQMVVTMADRSEVDESWPV
jgi:hypothetical protein